MALGNNGQGLTVNMKVGGTYLPTTTSQYKVVGIRGNTSSADWTAYLCNAGADLENTETAYYPIGVNQTLLSASSTECKVVYLGLSKAKCASTVTAGDIVMPYDGASTTTFSGHIESMTLIDETNVTAAAYGMSIASIRHMLGRAMEDGVTNSVITIIVNPQVYDRQFFAYT